jgi:CHAT domain-containing protein
VRSDGVHFAGVARFRLRRPNTALRPVDPRRRLISVLVAVLASSSIVIVSSVHSQEWRSTGTIAVGQSPESAVIIQDVRALYVANRASCDITIIDLADNRSTTTLAMGKSPKAMVASKDGQRLYVLLEDSTPLGSAQLCPGSNSSTHEHWLAVVNTSAKTHGDYIPLPGTRWDEMALAADQRLFITGVEEGGVYVFDTKRGELEQNPVIHDDGCPTGIAISERRIYVSYQCYGPQGDAMHPAHDTIGVYESQPPYRRIDVITGLANVGGQLALSPDRSQLWIAGNDACSLLDYRVEDCPTIPARIVNIVGTSDLKPLKSYGLSLEDFNGKISFSPDGVALIGGGIFLKEIASDKLVPVEDVRRLPIANVADVVFSPDGNTAYMVVSDRGVVQVMSHAQRGQRVDYTKVQSLTAYTVFDVLGVHGNYGHCVENAHDSRNAKCFLVPPQNIAPELWGRAEDVSLRNCGYPDADHPNKSRSDVYRCAANAALSLYFAGKIDKDNAIEWAMDMRALEANEEIVEWRVKYAASARKCEHKTTSLKSEATKEPSELLNTCRDADSKDSRGLNDVTLRLYKKDQMRNSLGNGASILSVFSWGDHTYSVLISKDDATIQEDLYGGQPVGQHMLDDIVRKFINRLSASSGAAPAPEAVTLFKVLIGSSEIADKLRSLETDDPTRKATLVWVTEGKLRGVPMAALSPDGRRFLVESFSSAVQTTPSAPDSREHGSWEALAVGTTHAAFGWSALPGVKEELTHLFSDSRSQTAAKIPARILLDEAFTAASFGASLQEIKRIGHERKDFLVFVASHFVPDADAGEQGSFIITGDLKKLTLLDLSNADQYPFKGVKLVVFSACNTAALSSSSKGNELEGMAYHLDQRGNGANSVLATLWSIDPDTSADLMKGFDGALQQGMSMAEALRQAEVSVLKGGAPPKKWAAFMLMGDWR